MSKIPQKKLELIKAYVDKAEKVISESTMKHNGVEQYINLTIEKIKQEFKKDETAAMFLIEYLEYSLKEKIKKPLK